MELSKKDTQMTKGMAILFMIILHLFCRETDLPYDCIKIANGVPLVYYLGLFCNNCVAIYCFCSGYAMYVICEKFKSTKEYYKGRAKSLFRFLINFWIVVVLFSVVGVFFDKSGQIPGNFAEFLGNMLLYKNSYNGSWWFVLTYILLVLISRYIYLLITNTKINPILVNIAFLLIYLAAYFQRFNEIIKTDVSFVNFVISQLALLGTSILPFVLGMYFYKYRIFTKIRIFARDNIKNIYLVILSISIILCTIVAHGIVKSLIVTPFTGIVTVIVFNVVNKGKLINCFFEFFGKHSTNIWLTHMFFYFFIFKDLVFVAKYPFFILVFMMAITVAVSYCVNLIYNPLVKLIK